MNKFKELLIKILNTYDITAYNNKKEVLTFTPVSDWDIADNGSSAKLEVRKEKSKTKYYVEIFNLFDDNKQLSSYICSEGRTYGYRTEQPDNSILKITNDQIFKKMMKLIQPGDFEDYIELFKNDNLEEELSDDLLSLMFIDFILTNSFFDDYIIKKNFITNKKLIKSLSIDYIYEFDFNLPNNDKIDTFENMINELCANYADDINYIYTIEDLDDLEAFNENIIELRKLFTNKVVDYYRTYVKFDDKFKEMIDNPEKYKTYFLSDDELMDLYSKTNKDSYEIEDHYHGGIFYFKFKCISKNETTIEYTFDISVIVDPITGEEYDNYENALDGSITIGQTLDGKIIECEFDNSDSVLHKLDLDIILDELVKHNFVFL